ncbi:hypothetical protein QU481_23205 [Crenobacter sp. SG2303]|uniref:Uncharacterized protein n=1 Tax=Crenobacter oryzisoli TaxID=3056844 RepID=A0ABT7XVA6_9NEIS|nr:hypothetical protein [Crenobacter sp. SG2303]MDN0077721.1 hypothetical protein [Crenobacter sp. SG2303]
MNGSAMGSVDFDSISQTGCASLRSPLSPTIPGPRSKAGSQQLAPMMCRSSRRRRSPCTAFPFLRERLARAAGVGGSKDFEEVLSFQAGVGNEAGTAPLQEDYPSALFMSKQLEFTFEHAKDDAWDVIPDEITLRRI